MSAITRAIGAEVAALPSSASLGWVRISSKPLKQTLATWASKWVYLFTKHLQDKVCWGPWGRLHAPVQHVRSRDGCWIERTAVHCKLSLPAQMLVCPGHRISCTSG